MRRMPRRIRNALGILLFLLMMGILLQFDWGRMMQPTPLLSVLAGTVILTLSQWKRGMPVSILLNHARWNAFLAGLLTSLFGMLSLLSGEQDTAVTVSSLADKLIPFLYGSLFALPWKPAGSVENDPRREDTQPDAIAVEVIIDSVSSIPPDINSASYKPLDIDSTSFALAGSEERHTVSELISTSAADIHRILKAHGFTPRECHVAQKLLEDVSNREIAESLYISETTVKKHIQNLFRKCGATDRRSFRKLFHQWNRQSEASASR